MKPGTMWIAIMLIAVGVCGLLDAAGIVDSSQTIGEWWPIALVGWAVTEMVAARRVTLGGLVCAALGATLLADAQAWASDALVWSLLAVFIGAALLVDAVVGRGDHHGAHEVRSLSGGGAS